MIFFRKVRYKNFLSTGNAFNEIDLGANETTLIVGDNGSGKSTMLDAISFALFGKAYRNINKPQLINTINNKDCVVEIEFNVAGNEYKVTRGIKPNIFEIECNGKSLNESSNSRDFQKLLEQNILKLNHKSFHQIVVIGSSSFVPFMQLGAAQRREVIEDILDIGVFSKMNTIIKERTAETKNNIRDNEYESDKIKTKIDLQRKYINEVKLLNDEKTQRNKDKIADYTKDLNDLRAKYDKLTKKFDDHYTNAEYELSELKSQLGQSDKSISMIERTMKDLMGQHKFFKENDVCPTCTQSIDANLKSTKSKDLVKEFKAAESELRVTHSIMGKLEESISVASRHYTEGKDILDEKKQIETKISMVLMSISELKEELQKDIKSEANVDEAVSLLQTYQTEKEVLLETKIRLNEEHTYQRLVMEMLKDGGIKTKIIRQYIPIMNKYINEYLQILDFFVHFELTDTFQEVIRSRHRDKFSYESFSEGEKQRVDLALLFTWRQIAKMKNSVATNLLILDETFDSSLDNDGIENLIKIIQSLGGGSNIFVISHKGEILENRFHNRIEFYKDKNFSKMR